jgi:uridine phosphorylase
VLNPDGSVYHLHLKNEHVADHVILVGDPGRVDQVGAFFQSIQFKIRNREFSTITGTYNGKRVTALSTGIGTDNIDIVINELDAAVNIDLVNRVPLKERRSLNLIRIGTSGSLREEIPVDSFVVSSYGLGLDGLVYYYDGFKPSDLEIKIAKALNEHLNWDTNLSTPYIVSADQDLLNLISEKMHSGITVTATGFYGPQGREIFLKPANAHMHKLFRSFEFQGLKITNFEMETSAIYALGRMLGHRCCTCCVIIANRFNKRYSSDYKPAVDKLILTVLEKLTAG